VVSITGNVGIGTAGPIAELHISASEPNFRLESENSSTPVGSIGWHSGATQRAFMEVSSEDSNSAFLIGSDVRGLGTDVDAIIQFRGYQDTSVINTIMTLNGRSGNVGIGTTSPNSLLQINGTTNSLLNITNGTDDFVTVLNTGNVGIGTASPQATLDIEDTSLPQLRISGGSGGGDVVIVFSELAESAHWLVGLDDTDNRFTISETSVDPGTDSRFSILPGGNVGINNTAPTHTLEVVGTFNATASQSSIVLDEAGDINIGI